MFKISSKVQAVVLGVLHANQTSMCLDPQGEVGAVKQV